MLPGEGDGVRPGEGVAHADGTRMASVKCGIRHSVSDCQCPGVVHGPGAAGPGPPAASEALRPDAAAPTSACGSGGPLGCGGASSSGSVWRGSLLDQVGRT